MKISARDKMYYDPETGELRSTAKEDVRLEYGITKKPVAHTDKGEYRGGGVYPIYGLEFADADANDEFLEEVDVKNLLGSDPHVVLFDFDYELDFNQYQVELTLKAAGYVLSDFQYSRGDLTLLIKPIS